MAKVSNYHPSIGVDMTTISRFNDPSASFVKTVLSPSERKEYQESKNKPQYLATRWAVKEAFFKVVMSMGIEAPGMNKLSLCHSALGAPYIIGKGISDPTIYSVSISHEGDNVIAVVYRTIP
ncbi:MAG: holo-ACP synthase [Coprobacillus sp.]|nr:holo-ACP synthase [Coprobacillus sp.]